MEKVDGVAAGKAWALQVAVMVRAERKGWVLKMARAVVLMEHGRGRMHGIYSVGNSSPGC